MEFCMGVYEVHMCMYVCMLSCACDNCIPNSTCITPWCTYVCMCMFSCKHGSLHGLVNVYIVLRTLHVHKEFKHGRCV